MVRHNCKKCHYHQYEVTPSNLLRGSGCPVCSGREAKLGINTIWDTDRWMVDLGVSEEDTKKYTSQSGKKIIVTCPDCGREKKVTISSVYKRKTIGCSCGDGKSYPEKFVMNALEQLNVNFEIEYSPSWIDNKKYDFYIPELKCIIETHGMQHYDGGFERTGGRTLEEEKQNDKYKKGIALANGIKYYIELDCRESNLEWIKNSILHSELSQLFDLSNINWNKCAEFSNKNIVKEVCGYWNNKKDSETTKDLEKVFKLSSGAVRNYLKKGTKLGWCDYSSKEELRKSVGKNGKSTGKKVEILKNGKSLGTFASSHELERRSKELYQVKLLQGNISAVCLGKRKSYKGYQFKYIENVA